MNCAKFKKNLPSYIDGNMSEDEKEVFQKHLNSCSDCSVLSEKVAGSLAYLKTKKDIEVQAFYFTRLKQKMENKVEEKSFLQSALFKKSFQLSAYFASLVIAVYIGILIGTSSGNNVRYSDANYENKDYFNSYKEYQYFNDFEIEKNNDILLTDTIE